MPNSLSFSTTAEKVGVAQGSQADDSAVPHTDVTIALFGQDFLVMHFGKACSRCGSRSQRCAGKSRHVPSLDRRLTSRDTTQKNQMLIGGSSVKVRQRSEWPYQRQVNEELP